MSSLITKTFIGAFIISAALVAYENFVNFKKPHRSVKSERFSDVLLLSDSDKAAINAEIDKILAGE